MADDVSKAYKEAMSRISRAQSFWGVGAHDPDKQDPTRGRVGAGNTGGLQESELGMGEGQRSTSGTGTGTTPRPNIDENPSSFVSTSIPNFRVTTRSGRVLGNQRLDPALGRLEDARVAERAIRHSDEIRRMMEDTGAPIYRAPAGHPSMATPEMVERAQTQATRQKELTDPLTVTQGEVPRSKTREEEQAENREHHAKRKVEATATQTQAYENIDRDAHARHLKDGGTMPWEQFQKKQQKSRKKK